MSIADAKAIIVAALSSMSIDEFYVGSRERILARIWESLGKDTDWNWRAEGTNEIDQLENKRKVLMTHRQNLPRIAQAEEAIIRHEARFAPLLLRNDLLLEGYSPLLWQAPSDDNEVEEMVRGRRDLVDAVFERNKFMSLGLSLGDMYLLPKDRVDEWQLDQEINLLSDRIADLREVMEVLDGSARDRISEREKNESDEVRGSRLSLHNRLAVCTRAEEDVPTDWRQRLREALRDPIPEFCGRIRTPDSALDSWIEIESFWPALPSFAALILALRASLEGKQMLETDDGAVYLPLSGGLMATVRFRRAIPELHTAIGSGRNLLLNCTSGADTVRVPLYFHSGAAASVLEIETIGGLYILAGDDVVDVRVLPAPELFGSSISVTATPSISVRALTDDEQGDWEEDDDWDDDEDDDEETSQAQGTSGNIRARAGRAGWPSKTGNPSGKRRDNAPPRTR